jgi:hypothetical protein
MHLRDAVQLAQRFVVKPDVLGGQVVPQVSYRAGPRDEQHVRGQLQQPLQRDLRLRGAKAGRRPGYHRAAQHGVVPAARPAERAERHERDPAAKALLQDRGPAAVG